MKIHHKMSHGESLAGFQKECDYCGKGFEAMMSETKYCSQQCFGKDNSRGSDNPAWSGGGSIEVCEQCGQEYDVKSAKKDSSRFCSTECFSQYRSENWLGESHPSYRAVAVECSECGSELHREPHTYREGGNHFCDSSCHGQWMSENWTGEDHPCWEGGYTHRVGNWRSQRRKRIEKDGSRCRICGVSREQHREMFGRDIEVHHITKQRFFDSPSEANALSNLVTLCMECHDIWEDMGVFPEMS